VPIPGAAWPQGSLAASLDNKLDEMNRLIAHGLRTQLSQFARERVAVRKAAVLDALRDVLQSGRGTNYVPAAAASAPSDHASVSTAATPAEIIQLTDGGTNDVPAAATSVPASVPTMTTPEDIIRLTDGGVK
jgi:hypothetical protein